MTWPDHSGLVSRPDARDALMLAAIVMVVSGVNYAWLSANRLPPHWDQANHMLSALGYHHVLETCVDLDRGLLRGFARCGRALMYVDRSVYAPLFPLLGGMMIFAAGRSITAMAMTNVPFLALLVLSMYGLGRRLHSRAAGVLAALLVCAYPLVFTTSREFMLELPLLALTAASVCLLVLSDGFAHRARTLLFGVAMGLALLTKFTYLFFIVGPFLFEVGRLAIDVGRRRVTTQEGWRRGTSVAGACLAAIALAALWYLPNRQSFVATLFMVSASDTTGASRLATASLLFYARAIAWDLMGLPLFALFVYGLFHLRTLSSEARSLLLVWIVSIYGLCTLAVFKAPHNAIGILIPTALVSAFGVTRLTRGRSMAMATVAGFACLQFAGLSLPGSPLVARVGAFGWSGASTAPPQAHDWRIERVLEALATRPARVVVVSDHPFVNGTTAQFYARQNGWPLEISPCWAVAHSAGSDFSAFDFVMAKSDLSWVRPKADGCFNRASGRDDYAALLLDLARRADAFTLERSSHLPDGSTLLVYRTVGRDTSGVAGAE